MEASGGQRGEGCNGQGNRSQQMAQNLFSFEQGTEVQPSAFPWSSGGFRLPAMKPYFVALVWGRHVQAEVPTLASWLSCPWPENNVAVWETAFSCSYRHPAMGEIISLG